MSMYRGSSSYVPWKSSLSNYGTASKSDTSSTSKYDGTSSYSRTRPEAKKEDTADKAASSRLSSTYGTYGSSYRRDTSASRDANKYTPSYSTARKDKEPEKTTTSSLSSSRDKLSTGSYTRGAEVAARKAALEKKDDHPPVTYRTLSRTGCRTRDPSPAEKEKTELSSSSSGSYSYNRLYPKTYTRSVSRERSESVTSPTSSVPKYTGRSSTTKDDALSASKYSGRSSISKDDALGTSKYTGRLSRQNSKEDLPSTPSSRYKTPSRTSSREDLSLSNMSALSSSSPKYIQSRFLPKNSVEKSYTAYPRTTVSRLSSNLTDSSRKNRELLNSLSIHSQFDDRSSRPTSRCSSVCPEDVPKLKIEKATDKEKTPTNEKEEMETVSVVTRATSPSLPQPQTNYVRNRRTEVAKVLEKEITRPKKRKEMVDKEIQSDRLDDTARYSRFGASSLKAAAPWSNYLDLKYSSPSSAASKYSRVGGYSYTGKDSPASSQTESSTDKPKEKDSSNAESEKVQTKQITTETKSSLPTKTTDVKKKTVDKDGKVSKSSSSSSESTSSASSTSVDSAVESQKIPRVASVKNLVPSSSKTDIKSKDVKAKSTSTSPAHSDAVKPKSNIATKTKSTSDSSSKKSLPPQIPKAESPAKIIAALTANKDFRKSVLNMNLEGKAHKKSPKRSGSVSSESEASSASTVEMQPSEATDISENLSTCASYHDSKSSSAAKLPQRIQSQDSNDLLSRERRSNTRSPSLTSESSTTSATASSSEDDQKSRKSNNALKTNLKKPMIISADELPADRCPKPPPSPRNKLEHMKTEAEAKSFLMRALAPVTSLFKIRHQDSSHNVNWMESSSENIPEKLKQSPSTSSASSKPLRLLKPCQSGERAWWLDDNADLSDGAKKDEDSLGSVQSSTTGEKLKQSSPLSSSASNKASGPSDKKPLRSLRPCQSGERAWWLDDTAEPPQGVKVEEETQSSQEESSKDGKVFYKIRKNESTDKAWWLDTNDNVTSDSSKSKSGGDNAVATDPDYLKKHKLRHIDSGERAWWQNSAENILEEDAKDQKQDGDKPNYKLWHQNSGPSEWWLASNKDIRKELMTRHASDADSSSDEDDLAEPLGDRRSPEGLETPREEERGRLSPYDNVPGAQNVATAAAAKRLKNPTLFISRHTNIDDILGSSTQPLSPLMDRIFGYQCAIGGARSGECAKVDAHQVKIHDSTAQMPVFQKNRIDVIGAPKDAESTEKLDDAALQLYKDGDYGSYLDLEASISEQQEEFEGFQTNEPSEQGCQLRILANGDSESEKEDRDLEEEDSQLKDAAREATWDASSSAEDLHNHLQQPIKECADRSVTAGSSVDSCGVVVVNGEPPLVHLSRSVTTAVPSCKSIAHRDSDLLIALTENCMHGPVCYFCSKKNSIVLRTQLSVRVHTIIEKLLNSEGRELRRALFSLKQIFQEDKDLVHEFVQNDGLACLIKVGSEADQNYQNYILRALGQVMLYVDGMNGVMEHNQTVQWLYTLISSKFRLVVKTALKLLLVFVEYTDSNCMLLIKAVSAVDSGQCLLPWYNIMKLLKDFDSADTELLIYATTLINKCLNGIPDQDTYYDQADSLEEQGIEAIIQRYMSKPGTDLDLLQQFQIYEAVLHHEDGDDRGTPIRHLDESIRKTLRSRKSVADSAERRKSRRHSTGTTPLHANLNNALKKNNSVNNNIVVLPQSPPLVDDDEESSSSHSSQGPNDVHLNGSYKENNKANEAGVTPALRRRRERAERQRSFIREQQESAALLRGSVSPGEENENGNYPNALQQRLTNGNMQLIRNSSRKDLTPLMNAVNKLDSEETNNGLNKQPWILSMMYGNGKSVEDNEQENQEDTENTNENDRDLLLQLKRENTVKDLTQKLANQNIIHSPSSDDAKINSRIGDMTGLISKAKEGLAKSKSKADVIKSPTAENIPKVLEVKKTENELRWEELIHNMTRPLNLCDMDFTDLASDDDDADVLQRATFTNGVPPPPPPLNPPPAPPSSRIPPPAPNPPVFGVNLQRFTKQTTEAPKTNIPKKSKKTVKLFWKEVRDDPMMIMRVEKSTASMIWDELSPVTVDTQKLEHLFESRAKDLITKKQQEMNKNKEIIVLDPKRSNAINIGMTKLPPPRSIKTAILKMDATIMNREGIEKLLTMLPTEEERTKIQDAQASNPDLPLGSAEQFLLTLASISELPARLKLWAFKLDFENSEREIAEPLMDLKQGIEVLRVNKTFRGILSTLLSIGIFLNGNEVKGFQIEYLAKVPEVKDTVHKHSLLHHLCHIVMEKFPDATDLYSEIGAITRASKIDFDELALNIQRLETDCKASWDHLKLIAKHDGSTMMKIKMSDFLSDCAERIILLGIVHRRVMNRYHKFLLWLGIPLHQISDSKPNEFCRIVSEFSLEYRTTRERVLQQLEKKANHRERNKTRGKMITETGKFKTKEDRADAELRQLLGSDLSDVESLQGTLPWRRQRRDVSNRSLLPNGNFTDGDDEILESLVKTATKNPSSRTAPRERKRTRHADRKSLRRTLKNGLSEEEKKHISAYIKGY